MFVPLTGLICLLGLCIVVAQDTGTCSSSGCGLDLDVKDNVHYVWSLVREINLKDLSEGASYQWSEEFSCTQTIDRKSFEETMKKKVQSMGSQQKVNVDAGGSVELLSFKASGEASTNLHQELYSHLTNQKEERETKEWKHRVADSLTVRGGDSVAIYQLQVHGPGIMQHSSVYYVGSAAPLPQSVEITYTLRVPRIPQGPIPPGRYAIKSIHGTFIRGHSGGEGSTVDQQTKIDEWEKWTVVQIPGTTHYGIRSVHGTYMRAHSGGEGRSVDLQVDQHNWDKMTWEQFVLVPAAHGRFGIRSVAHGTFIRAHQGGEGAHVDQQVDKHNWEAQTWEQFEFIVV